MFGAGIKEGDEDLSFRDYFPCRNEDMAVFEDQEDFYVGEGVLFQGYTNPAPYRARIACFRSMTVSVSQKSVSVSVPEATVPLHFSVEKPMCPGPCSFGPFWRACFPGDRPVTHGNEKKACFGGWVFSGGGSAWAGVAGWRLRLLR